LLLLEAKAFGGEDRVGFGIGGLAETFEQIDDLVEARRAGGAVGEVFGCRWIRRPLVPRLEVVAVQASVVQMRGVDGHGLPPSNPRSFRAARNKWTRTVDSFRPVMALTSRGVQSP